MSTVKDFVRVGIANPAKQGWVRESAFQCMIAPNQHPGKGLQCVIENLKPARIQITQRLLALQEMQRSALFGASLGQHQTAIWELKRCQAKLSHELGATFAPMQTSSNHEVDNQPQFFIQ